MLEIEFSLEPSFWEEGSGLLFKETWLMKVNSKVCKGSSQHSSAFFNSSQIYNYDERKGWLNSLHSKGSLTEKSWKSWSDISRFRILLQMHLLHKLQPFKYVAICYFVGKLVECSFFTQLTLSYSILEMLCHSNRKLIQHNCRFRWQSTCHMF